jgi:type IV secretion system protein VirD4
MRSFFRQLPEVPHRISRALFIAFVLLASYSVVLMAGTYGPVVAILAAAGIVKFLLKRMRRKLSAFGTAKWASEDEVRAAKMLDGRPGLILGRLHDYRGISFASGIRSLFDPRLPASVACRRFLVGLAPRIAGPRLIVRLPDAVHTAVFAPTGVGKSVSLVIPSLLECPDSAVVVDFKGELAQTTAEHRRRRFGHSIVLLDPFKIVTKTPDSFNPLDFIERDSPTAIDDCRDLAEQLVIRTGEEKDPHFLDSGEIVIGGTTATVVQYADPDDRSLQTVKDVVSDPGKWEAAVKLACSSDAWDGMLARLGLQLTHFKEKELASTMTTTNRFLRFLDTPSITECTARTTFNPRELRAGTMTVYLILPPHHARAQSALLRMWIGGLLRAVIREGVQS